MPPAAEVLDHVLERDVLNVAEVAAAQVHALLVLAPGQVRVHVALGGPGAAVPADLPAQLLQLLADLIVFLALRVNGTEDVMAHGSPAYPLLCGKPHVRLQGQLRRAELVLPRARHSSAR